MLQVVEDERLSLKHAVESRSQVVVKLRVMLEPPKTWPSERNERGTGLTKPFEFRDGGGIIGGRTPILAGLLQEREHSAMGQLGPQLVFVHQDEGDGHGDRAGQRGYGRAQPARVGWF